MNRRLGKILLTIGLCGMLGSLIYSGRNLYRTREIYNDPSYKRVAEIDSQLSFINSMPIKNLLAPEPNNTNPYQLTQEYNKLLTEKTELLKNPKVIDLKNEIDYMNTKGLSQIIATGTASTLVLILGAVALGLKKQGST